MAEGLRVDEAYERGEFKSTKTRRERFVPLPASLRTELADYMTAMPDKRPMATLIPTVCRTPMSNHYMSQHIQQPARDATGLDTLTMRQGRTTYAPLLRADVADVRDMMGHRDVRTTLEHYRRAIPARALKAAEELDSRISGKPKLRMISGRRAG
jgi:integrase